MVITRVSLGTSLYSSRLSVMLPCQGCLQLLQTLSSWGSAKDAGGGAHSMMDKFNLTAERKPGGNKRRETRGKTELERPAWECKAHDPGR